VIRLVPLGEVLHRSTETVARRPDGVYREVTVRLWGKGVVERRTATGAEIAGTRRFVVKPGQFILSRIDARNGACGIVPDSLADAVVSNDFPVFDVDPSMALPAYLGWVGRSNQFVDICRHASEGTTNRVRLQENRFLRELIPLPALAEQHRIVARIEELASKIEQAEAIRCEARYECATLLRSEMRRVFSTPSWLESALEDLCSEIVVDNLHSNPVYADDGVPCVRSPDVGWGTLNLDTALKTDEAEYRRRVVRGEPRLGDIVLVREGGGTGKCALVHEGQRFSLGQRVMMLRPELSRVLPEFLLFQLLSPTVFDDQIVPLSKGSASPHLNIGALRRFRLNATWRNSGMSSDALGRCWAGSRPSNR
jgi:type I restriction enzyme S subunit